MLVPGSIWERAKKRGEPTQSRVLCVSNEDLQPPASESFPPQVIFVTDKLKVLTMPIEQFIANRTYRGIDDHMKALAEALVTSPDVLDDDEEIDFDAVPLPDPVADEEPTISVVTAGKKRMQIADLLFGDEEPPVEQSTSTDLGVTTPAVPSEVPVAREVVFGLTLINGAPQYAQLLQQSFVGYNEAPFHTGDTQHALKFQLGTQFDLSMLHNAFFASADSVTSFSVVNSYETTDVTIDGYVDTFLSVERGIGYGVVYVTSAGDFRNKEYEDSQIPEDATDTPAVTTTVIDIPAAPAPTVNVQPMVMPTGVIALDSPEGLKIIANLAQQAGAQVNVNVG